MVPVWTCNAYDVVACERSKGDRVSLQAEKSPGLVIRWRGVLTGALDRAPALSNDCRSQKVLHAWLFCNKHLLQHSKQDVALTVQTVHLGRIGSAHPISHHPITRIRASELTRSRRRDKQTKHRVSRLLKTAGVVIGTDKRECCAKAAPRCCSSCG